MTGRVVRGRSRVLLSDSSSEEEDDSVDVVLKHIVAEGNVTTPSVVAIPDIDSMFVEDEIEDDEIEEEPPPVISFPLADRTRSIPQENNMRNSGGGGSPLHQLLRRRGINVNPEWLDSFVRAMEGSQPGFSTSGVDKQGELALAHLLITDFNEVCAGCLPDSFETLHAIELAGPFVLQVDEISDIGAPLRERYHERGAGISRCLKLSMTDGAQRVIGIEYKPIAALRNLLTAGFKICVRNVFVRHGVFLLSCDNVEVIGGFVQRLEEARLRVVHEVNKPARGSRRNRRGQTGDRSLSDRATAEAWPRNTDAAAAHIPPDTPSEHSVQPLQPTAASTFQSFGAPGQPARGVRPSQFPETHANVQHGLYVPQTETRLNATMQQATPAAAPTRSETRSNPVQQAAPAIVSRHVGMGLNVEGQQSNSAVGSTFQSLQVKRKQTTIPWVQSSMNDARLQESSSGMQTKTPGFQSTLQRVVENNTSHDGLAPPSGVQTPVNLDSDEDEFENLLDSPMRRNTPGFSEEPFTYLALLKENRAVEPGCEGAVAKIKCVLTGVKDFQYKDCDEFTLIVHIDDGSLVTEALIHHDIVQKMVGFSPKEVNRALAKSSSQESREMKSNMKRFQLFLKKFEGLIHVQYKKSLSMPVISHMEEGVAGIDLAALQNRVGKDTLMRGVPVIEPEFIAVSP